MRALPWLALGGAGVALAAVLIAAYSGALGPLATCGADGAPVCIAWAGAASVATWLVFLGIIAGLIVTQSADWRQTSVARREWLLLLVVLFAALLERAIRPDLSNVGYDESAAASLVAAWRLDGLFPLTGIVSSVGIPNPPGWPYLLATVLLWFDSPYAVLGIGIAAGLLSVVLVWWVGRRWIGAWGALGAAVFYAFGFWAAFLGRTGWQPVFLQLPLILCLDALLILAVRRRAWAFPVACGWLGLMVQLHYIALVFVVMLPIAAWPARRLLRPVHVVSGGLIGLALLAPFLIYELNPAIRFGDFGRLSADAAGQGSHWDFEAWNLMWTLASNRGVAGLGGPDTEGLRQALGRWSNLGLIGVALVACGAIVAVAGWPRGWRGWLITAWMLTPAIGLAHHTLGLLFHYLYLSLPGMALAVGALAEWVVLQRRTPVLRWAVSGALAVYVGVSAATLLVVLDQVQQSGKYTGDARPLGLNMAAALTARSELTSSGHVLIGGQPFKVEILRFALGHDLRPTIFDDCAEVPADAQAIYLMDSEGTPAATALTTAGAPLLARVPRSDGAFVVYGQPVRPVSVTPATNCP
jgi:hypothetical protein